MLFAFSSAWQQDYGAFSVGISQVQETVDYIEQQLEHHRTRTLQEEYLAFLKKHGAHSTKNTSGISCARSYRTLRDRFFFGRNEALPIQSGQLTQNDPGVVTRPLLLDGFVPPRDGEHSSQWSLEVLLLTSEAAPTWPVTPGRSKRKPKNPFPEIMKTVLARAREAKVELPAWAVSVGSNRFWRSHGASFLGNPGSC
jgi:hypothetical protein